MVAAANPPINAIPDRAAPADATGAGITGPDRLQAALSYLKRGWSALALCPPDHKGVSDWHNDNCKGNSLGKTPCGKYFQKWLPYKDQHPHEKTLKLAWAENPLYNVGVAMGPVSGLFSLDIDGDEGEAALDAWEQANAPLPPTLEFNTAKGRRLLFRWPAEPIPNEQIELGGGEVRVLSKGRQTAMPPSVHYTGFVYEWEPGHGPGEIEAAEAPAWLIKLVLDAKAKKAVPPPPPPVKPTAPAEVAERARKYLKAMGECHPEPEHPMDASTHLLKAANALAIGFALDDAAAVSLLAEWDVLNAVKPYPAKELERKVREAREHPHWPKGAPQVFGYLLAKDNPMPKAGAAGSGPDQADDGNGPPGTAKVHEAGDDPHFLARLFVADHKHRDGATLLYWREEWYVWNGRAWEVIPAKDLKARLCQRIKAEFDRQNLRALKAWKAKGGVDEKGRKVPQPVARKVTTRVVADTTQALAGLVLLPAKTEAPSWLLDNGSAIAKCDPSEILVCANGMGHLSTLATEGILEPCTPRFFTHNALGYAFDPKAPPPKFWLEFLAQLWPKDVEAIRALQEVFGYALTGDTRQQKIVMLVGPKRSGKGTIARVLRALVGVHNTCSPTLAGLGTNFGLWPLLGKTLAIISDARLSGRTDAAMVVERLLSISGEDAQTIDRKNMPHVTTKLTTRFVILTNELPKLSDPSGALAGRLVLLRLTESFYGREDTALTDRLLTELPGILLWALEGWLRLKQRSYFLQPKSGQELILDMEDLSSPIGAFVRERCEVGPGREVFVRDLFAEWKAWCEEKGRKEPGHEQTFGRDLRACLPALDVRQPRDGDKRVRLYVGLRLRQEEHAARGL